MGNDSERPEEQWLYVAHKRSIYHRTEIENSYLCGCFHCRSVFRSNKIREWTDVSKPMPEQTALCPHCGIDSVVGDDSGFEITDEFLAKMCQKWF